MKKILFIGFQHVYSRVCLSKYIQAENVFFYEGTGKGKLTCRLQKIHCCESVNKIIDLPLKSVWFNNFSNARISADDDIYFIFSKSQSWLLQYKNGQYINQLKRKYPKCKIILYLWDLISSYYKFDVCFFKEKCDLVLTYDLGDSQKYEIIYCPTPYSPVKIIDDSNIKQFDVYFCGKAKNRLNDIFEVYMYLKNNNMKCKFFITDVPRKQQRFKEDITYNKRISYYQNLQYLQKSRIVLDIVQKGSKGDTLRIKEAVTYGKKIITNNLEVRNNPYYVINNICVYEHLDEIRDLFLQNLIVEPYPKIRFDDLDRILKSI